MGEQGKGNGSMNSLQRVKVYQLKNDGKWDDKGTGHVTVDYLERSEDLGLIVVDEEDHVTLISHRISSDEIYKKQEDTIISWRDPEFLTEVALSFQEPTGCSYIWDGICGVQRNLHFNTLSNLEGGPRPTMAALDSAGGSHSNDESFHAVNNELRELPSLELSTLPLILKTLLECGMTDQLRVADLILQDQDFFPKLVDLFRMCEESKDMDGLHMIFRLVKAIILLNSLQIFDRIFGDEFILDIIGSLEYDPDLAQMQNHRSFLKEHVIFKEAIPIKDPLVLSKIHQTYRIGYIKDVILPRVLDEATIASLSAIVLTNNAAVVSSLKDDASFIQELFAKMKSPSISAESKRNLVLFLHEFCTLSKSLQGGQQLRLFRELAGDGVFDIIANLLQSEDRKLVLIGTDILILFLHVDSNLLRSYVIQPEGIGFLGLLVKGLVSDFGEEMHCQFLEILRILLDSNTLPGPQRDTIIDIFYEKHLDQLIDVITSSCPSKSISDKNSKSTYSRRLNVRAVTKPEILLNICELLCFCVLHHPYRIKCNFLMNNIIEKVLFLTFRRERFLAVATVRFMRAIVSRNDDHLLRHIAKNNLLKPIIDAFIENGSRYNMLHSGVLELLEFIRKENIKILILYVVDTFWGQLLKFEHLGPIQGLRLKYEQSLENCDIKNSAIVTDPRKRTEERALEKEEEDYFNEDSDEEDSTSAHSSRTWDEQKHPSLPNGTKASYSSFRSASGGLVDYEDDDDDDDDDDYNPPKKTEASTGDDRESSKSKRKSTSKADHDDGDFEVTKKRRLNQDLNDSKIDGPPVHSLCTDIDFPNQKAQLCDATPQTTESNYSLDENGGEEENAGPQSCNKSLPEVEDNRQSSGDDCPPSEQPIDNSSSDVVANGANSEPYSVR